MKLRGCLMMLGVVGVIGILALTIGRVAWRVRSPASGDAGAAAPPVSARSHRWKYETISENRGAYIVDRAHRVVVVPRNAPGGFIGSIGRSGQLVLGTVDKFEGTHRALHFYFIFDLASGKTLEFFDEALWRDSWQASTGVPVPRLDDATVLPDDWLE